MGANLITSRNVAKLRSLECRVGTVLGHDARHGEFYYAVRLPKGIDAEYVGRVHTSGRHQGRIARSKWEKDVVHVYVPRTPNFASTKNYRDSVKSHARDAAYLLGVLVSRVEEYDRAGNASRQHYIETGRYLREEEVVEFQPAVSGGHTYVATAEQIEAYEPPEPKDGDVWIRFEGPVYLRRDGQWVQIHPREDGR